MRIESVNIELYHVPLGVSPSGIMVPSSVLLLPLLLSLLTPVCASFQSQRSQQASVSEVIRDVPRSLNGTCSGHVVCKPGIVLPVWTPLNPSPRDQAGRAVVYFLCLMYLFLGVSIIADRFMASIEVITSQVPLIVLCVCRQEGDGLTLGSGFDQHQFGRVCGKENCSLSGLSPLC